MNDSVSTTGNKDVLKATLQLMSTCAADYCPESYSLWFSYAMGDPVVTTALTGFVDSQRRMTIGEQADYFNRLLAPKMLPGQDEVFARLNRSLEQVECSVDGSLKGAAGLLEELEQFGASLSDEERAQFGDRIDRLTSAGHEVQYLMGKSASLLSNSKEDMPEFSVDGLEFSFEPAACVMELGAMFSRLHRLCESSGKSSSATALLIEVNRVEVMTESMAPAAIKAFIDNVARRVARIVGADGDVGHYHDRRILVLFGSQEMSASERNAVEIVDDLAASPVDLKEGVALQLCVSIGLTALSAGDIPEAVIGRLNRAVQRVAMRGSGGIEVS